ncbi:MULTISPECIES: carboxypeptidase regulatory-like domain-containing protein [Bacteroides]|uniref:carboxypeptidase regulatory-like domain-containing protein n=1 Tax=Bacteroides TaxID=816 RepID=UPI00142F2DE3|nr:carboxypeptidase regulatory-like domain-containing protein [Bacteroides thetaiotaomicron]MCE9136710.1 carboxypeptidase regulatory-like domain-containing protein [Bacteroides thetaiotaomicron]MCS2363027.1 carboxypeptidase regulatory-like domain-containing protein [Bacteroides thetaiotaomicron]MCS3233010.1 carboxypeptidase regulatory-like domain-containing protein [Bacteroides thetaiotaomicron]MDC2217295.1 carboxypeptidase regulatory-like domain-containing protein [Bacteroides thetaiotaomicron
MADEEATTGSLHGTIKDSENGNLLKGCLVVISPTGKSITTGDDGSFSFDNLAAGVFSIDVSKNDYEPAKKEVTIVAGQPNKADMQLTKQMPKLSVNKINLDFSDSETELPIEIRNDGKSTLKWEISTGTKWIKINPTSGTSTKDIASVLISVDRTGLSKGDYNGSINITSNGGTATIKVNMSIKGAVLKVTPSTLDFGEIETSKELFISNETEIGSITYSIQPSVNWIILSSNEGTVDTNTDKIKVLVNRDGLATNDYNEKLTINTKDGRKEISVIVKQIERTVAKVGIGSSFSDITETSFSIKGTILSTGGHEISSYGHCWSEHDTPTIENDNKNNFGNSTEIREFTSNISGLDAGKTYYVRAYAVNNKGTVYSEQRNITMPYIKKPIVKTQGATDIGKDVATLNGNITDNGGDKIIECGFYYGTSENTEIKKSLGDNSLSALKLVLTNLKESTTYYYKAYATNSKGTAYGEVMSFKTLSENALTVETKSATDITTKSATLNGTVLDRGSSNITEYGFYYGTNENTTNKKKLENSMDELKLNLTELAEGTTYYYKAYATNSKGTSYGEVLNFTTLPNIEFSNVSVSNITPTTASVVYSISLAGKTITETGVEYSTQSNFNNAVQSIGSIVHGTVSIELSSLSENTQYYIRPYTILNSSYKTVGNRVSFGTKAYLRIPPTKPIISNISGNSATATSTVTIDPYDEIIEAGMECSKDYYWENSSGYKLFTGTVQSDGTLKVDVTNLHQDFSYNAAFIRAYVITKNVGKLTSPHNYFEFK